MPAGESIRRLAVGSWGAAPRDTPVPAVASRRVPARLIIADLRNVEMHLPVEDLPLLRVGAVNYLNTKPLVHGLEALDSRLRLVLDLPSRLADRLECGELDAALVPVVELFQHEEYTIVSDACIACRGPVRSVKLYFRRPPRHVRSLALDEGSRTSVILAEILLKELAGVASPVVEPLPIGSGLASTRADAVLLIGDRAMYPQQESFEDVWDLGEAWCRWTGLPFVFAVWAANPNCDVACLEKVLGEARDRGIVEVDRIAAREAARMDLEEASCLAYLRENLHFYLGQRERAGLARFRELASSHRDLQRSLHDCAIR